MNKIISYIMLLFLVVFIVITSRFIYIQASGEIKSVSLKEWAKEIRETEMVLTSERGRIFDENDQLLAYNQPTYRLYAILDAEISEDSETPLHIVDVKETATKLAPFLDVKQSHIEKIIREGQRAEKWQVEFGKQGRNLSRQTMEDIEALQLPGINFMEDSLRYYSNGTFASHLIGFTRMGEETEKLSGIVGVESEYDELLKGEDGYIKYERDRYDIKLLSSDEMVKDPEDGHDIHLTINHKIQVLLEDVLSEVEEQFSPEKMSVTVMNGKTGEILAMSNRPSFDPNEILEGDNWVNAAISEPVEPGSTMKIFTWAAAINAGQYDGEELFPSGQYKVHPQADPVNDHNEGRGWGEITFDEGFIRSSNVAASRLVWDKLGSETFLEYLERFHFDEKTNIDLPQEKTGKILYKWPIEKISTSFGQGSTFTPIQQLKAATAIVNEGKMLRPYVVKKITDAETGKIVQENNREVVGEPIKKKTAEQMMRLLSDAVMKEEATGHIFQLDHYSVMGKTGTAQIPNPKKEGYLKGKNDYLFSFLGMAPQDDPQILVHIAVQQPKLKKSETGPEIVAYIFKHVMENSLRYLDIKPDKEIDDVSIDSAMFPNIINKDVAEAKAILDKEGIDVEFIGSGEKVIDSNVRVNEVVFPNERIIVMTDQPTMPNITGWSKRDVLQLTSMFQVELIDSGTGYAVEQSISEGTTMREQESVKVKFKTPK